MSRLFSSYQLRELSFRNRIFVSPMCQYSSENGMPNSWHLVHLGARAIGGAGLVMAEATAVSPEGRISPFDLGIWTDAQRDAFKEITRFIREQDSVPAIQLAHAGRKASTDAPWNGGRVVPPGQGGWMPIGPSPIPFSESSPVPTEMSPDDIQRVVDSFQRSAERSLLAGFQVVEIHMAHGYLLHEFLSPLSNQRKDQFGGSLENRMRFPLQVAQEVRRVWPANLPVFVRISATDWVEGGWDLPQSVTFCQRLKECGIDLIDCSTGGMVPDAVIPFGPGFQVSFANAIRHEAKIATGAVGLISDPHQAEEVISSEKADAVFLARELLRDPHWPLHAAQELGVSVKWPRQYERARIQ